MVSLADSAQAHPARLRQVTEQLLREGRYREGFELFEDRPTRWNLPTHGLPYPEWRGEDLRGKRLLVWNEQGLGDEIQMMRFIADVRRLGISELRVAAHPRLLRTYARLVKPNDLYPKLGTVSVARCDYWVGSLSLPNRLRLDRDRVPSGRYLTAPNPGEPSGIGLVWRGNPDHPKDHLRSLPSPELLAAVPGGRFLEPNGDIDDSLDQLSRCEALVTVDTSWAHMAGAMGLPCHILLPAMDADWRWGASGNRTPWYRSVVLHRQPQPGDWEGAVRSVLAALSAGAPG